MANITGTKGYNSSYRGSNPPGAFYAIYTSDFGEPAPAAPSLTYEAGTGSLATGTAHVKVTWITAEGVSLPSADAAVAVSASTGGVLIAQPTVPTSGATIIGWQVYSQGSSGTLLNTVAASTVPAPSTIVTNGGNVTGFPIATTSVVLDVYGTGAVVPTIDASGIQTAYPSIAANTTVDYYYIVPNAASQWKTYKAVDFIQPDSVTQTVGIVLGGNMDFVQPLYPGATPGVSTYTSVSVNNGVYMVMNGYLFQATQAGAGTTATAFIGWAAFKTTEGATTTDGTVTWTSKGKAGLVRAHFGNITAGALVPATQQVDLFQF